MFAKQNALKDMIMGPRKRAHFDRNDSRQAVQAKEEGHFCQVHFWARSRAAIYHLCLSRGYGLML